MGELILPPSPYQIPKPKPHTADQSWTLPPSLCRAWQCSLPPMAGSGLGYVPYPQGAGSHPLHLQPGWGQATSPRPPLTFSCPDGTTIPAPGADWDHWPDLVCKRSGHCPSACQAKCLSTTVLNYKRTIRMESL